MKLILNILMVAVIYIFCNSCSDKVKKEEDSILEKTTENDLHNITKGDVEIIIIDGCEYIVYKETDGANKAFGFMSHKGNCTNPIHIYNNIDTVLNNLIGDTIK